MITALSTIKDWFKNGDKPTEREFSDTWDSFWHKSDYIPQNKVVISPSEDFGLLLFTLRQSGTNAPEMTVLHSDFTYDSAWLIHYEGPGNYYVHNDEEYTGWAEQCFVFTSQPAKEGIEIRVKQADPYQLQVRTMSNGILSDNLLDGSVLFEVRIRPGQY
ncbi:MAG: hypothetical protein PSV16_14635 [Flavobacterium sp.]|nr:hypothetical protein [Flavobacterium sp.]